ncbi:hypothetical protein YIM73518_09490 [Thermus brockianus]|uniref:Uncharacterized protein n=1 Tax=Thermus brockianus TaxID=56956 RepID=A0ABN6NJC4_THEBO|nr:hypothetical protein TbrSNM41_22050 [Thermus brockianus]
MENGEQKAVEGCFLQWGSGFNTGDARGTEKGLPYAYLPYSPSFKNGDPRLLKQVKLFHIPTCP